MGRYSIHEYLVFSNQLHAPCSPCSSSCHADTRLRQQVVPSDDLEEGDSEDTGSPSLLNDELRQEMRSRRAKMHRYTPI